MIYDITPIAKPRMTQSDKWKKRPAVLKYRAFKDECRLKGVLIPESCKIIFYMPMPKHWSQKKKKEMDFKRHQVKPDLDNLIKAVLDATLIDDAHIWQIQGQKIWVDGGGGISVSELFNEYHRRPEDASK